jgi:hypothetical protein
MKRGEGERKREDEWGILIVRPSLVIPELEGSHPFQQVSSEKIIEFKLEFLHTIKKACK